MDAVKVNAISETLYALLVSLMRESGMNIGDFVNLRDGFIEFVRDKCDDYWFVLNGDFNITPCGKVDYERTSEMLMVRNAKTLLKSTLMRDEIVDYEYTTAGAFESALHEDEADDEMGALEQFDLHLLIRNEFNEWMGRRDCEGLIDYARRMISEETSVKREYITKVGEFEEVLKELVLESVTMPMDDVRILFGYRDRIITIANRTCDTLLYGLVD